MGLLDMFVNKETRLKNEAAKVEKEARELRAELRLHATQETRDQLQKELDEKRKAPSKSA